jgi:crotonobetaine/carnitine-CoA ligase
MPETIPELFDEAVAAVPDMVGLVAGDESFTSAEARERIGRAAAALVAAGLGPGDLVLAPMRSTPAYVFTWLASAYAGTILVTANPRSAGAELAGLLGQVRPRLVVSDAAIEGAVGVETLFENDAVLEGRGPAGPDDAAVLIPTSGTTGRSKLVTQTHRAYAMAGVGFPWWMELGPDDRLMTSLPLFHINAPTYSMLGSVGARASLALLPSFSASTFLESARRHGATEFNAIGAMLEILMRQPERPDDADTPLRL